ncbi:MAG: hemerythrin domain-containing protein [Candidatus Symbiothrix sp.]|jgi:regulator of cell morphogenesis and NO signaling|nr:hemerythrin domain-containing protein [Candidatus Symbiothrix sp.]
MYNKFRFGKYRSTDSMSQLISENYPALTVLSRFGITLGVGEKTIDEVCREHQVDTDTFLAIIHLISDKERKTEEPPIYLPALINYLRNSHTYFLEYRLPEIRKNLISVLTEGEDDLNKAVLEYFDQFTAAIRKHMLYENNKVFSMATGQSSREKLSTGFGKQHEQIEARLTEFKNILIKYYPAHNANTMNRFLFDIFNCEQELTFHNAVEDELFLPTIV